MAIRTIGSSLLAKSSPGGKYRETAEKKIDRPELPSRGKVGSIDRAQLEEPLERAVPQGSQKIIGSQPLVESQPGIPGDIAPEAALGANIPPTIRPGANAQALFAGANVPATGVPAGRINAPSAPTFSSGVGGGARPALAYQPDTVSVSKTQVGKPTQVVKTEPSVGINSDRASVSNIGGSPILSTGAGAGAGAAALRSLASGVINRGLTAVAELGAKGGKGGAGFMFQNPLYKSNLTPLQNIQQSPLANAVRSVQQAAPKVANNVRSAVSNVANKAQNTLRSLFRR